MSNYLYDHYKGKYRVLADYDLETNDFPRTEDGNIDPDFNDFYLSCRKGVQIRHAGRDKLGVYIFSNGIARNILTEIYERESQHKAPKKLETLVEHAIDEGIIEEATLYDGEVLFIFKAMHLDDWADIFKIKTSGAKISPLSSKNLPKSKYVISKEDEKTYSDILNTVPKDKRLAISRVAMNNIVNSLSATKRKEMKALGMKAKQYINYIGAWDKLLKELKKEIDNGQ